MEILVVNLGGGGGDWRRILGVESRSSDLANSDVGL